MAEKLSITVSAEDKASKELKNVEGSLDDLNSSITKVTLAAAAMGAAVAAALWKMTDNYAKAGDEVAKMSKRTGIAVETLSEMRYITELSGTTLASFETGIKRMQSTIIDATDGLSTATDAFDKLGLNIDDILRMSPEDQFWTIANAIASLEDPTLRSAVAVDFFGRAGTQMLPMLASGSQAIADMRQEAHDLNIVFTDETAAAAEQYVDSQTTMKAALQGLQATIAEEVMPYLENLITQLTEGLKKVAKWFKDNPEWVTVMENFGKALAAIVAAGTVITLVTHIMKLVAAVRSLNIGLILTQSLTGVGLLKVGAGLAAAAGAVYLMDELMSGGETGEASLPELELPSEQYGGIVPGPIGRPVPIIAHGGEEFAGVGGHIRGGGDQHIHVGTLIGDEVSMRKFLRMASQMLGEESRRNSFGQVNKGYYYGRSSI